MIWPTIAWNSGRCWAYLHDLEPQALSIVMHALRQAELERADPHSVLLLRR